MSDQPIRIAQIMGKMNGGGVESVVMNYYRKIDKSKFQFDFIIDSDSKLIPKDEIEEMGGRIILVSPYKKIFKYIKELKMCFLDNKYIIVHSHLNALSIIPLYCAYKTNIPIRIAHSHSTGNKKEGFRNILKIILKKFSKVFSTHYFACSEHAGIWLFGKKTFEKGKITIINNAIDIKKFVFNEIIRNKIRKELKIENKFVLGHVGRFMQQKNHDFIIDVFRKLYQFDNETLLLLIGNGSLEDKIREKVINYGLEKNVIFLGQKDNVNDYLNAMDVFVFPSLYEGLGIVVIEAQANNLPCVCSNAVPNEVNLNGKVNFLDINSNIEEWCETILKYKELIRGNSYNSDILNEYDINDQAKRLEKKYYDILEEFYDNIKK